jgi:hypothetical protein
LVIATCAASAHAQATWIVDPENRPGAHFTDLPPAIAASSSGDTIRLRASTRGISFAATTNKGLTIVGEGYHTGTGTLTISGLPASQRFVMQGVTLPFLNATLIEAQIHAVSCAGTVHLQDVGCVPQSQGGFPSSLRFVAIDCRRVTLRRCTMVGSPEGLTVMDSTILAIESQFLGNMLGSLSWSSFLRWTYPAASMSGSLVVAVDSNFAGGYGYTSPYLCSPVYPNRHGIRMNGGQLILAGCRVTGGTATERTCLHFLYPEPSAIGDGAILADDVTVLTPSPLVSLNRGNLAVTRTSRATVGGNLDVVIAGEPGNVAATFVSLPAAGVATPFGSLWLDPSLIALMDLGTLDNTGRRSFRITSLTVPAGVPLAFQTLILNGTSWSLTLPGVTVVQ